MGNGISPGLNAMGSIANLIRPPKIFRDSNGLPQYNGLGLQNPAPPVLSAPLRYHSMSGEAMRTTPDVVGGPHGRLPFGRNYDPNSSYGEGPGGLSGNNDNPQMRAIMRSQQNTMGAMSPAGNPTPNNNQDPRYLNFQRHQNEGLSPVGRRSGGMGGYGNRERPFSIPGNTNTELINPSSFRIMGR